MLNKEYVKYKTLHTHEGNLALHIFGNIVTLVFIALCIIYGLWWWLLLAPFIIYPFAWSGHIFFEGNRPAAWSNPIKAKICDWMMMRDLLLGRYF